MSITREKVAQIVLLVDQDYSTRKMARRFDCNHCTVSHIYHRYIETGSYTHRPRTGDTQVTNAREERRLVCIAAQEPFLTSSQISSKMNMQGDFTASSRTVCCRIKKHGMTSTRPATGPVLSLQHRRRHLEFARTHASWMEADWGRVLFPDVSFLPKWSRQMCTRVVAQCRALQPTKICTPIKFLRGLIMVWGGISVNAHTDLHNCKKGTVTAHMYMEDILLPHMVPSAKFIGLGFLLMQGNAHSHVVRTTLLFLDKVGIAWLDWPVCSPDANPNQQCLRHAWRPNQVQSASHYLPQGTGHRASGRMGGDSTRRLEKP